MPRKAHETVSARTWLMPQRGRRAAEFPVSSPGGPRGWAPRQRGRVTTALVLGTGREDVLATGLVVWGQQAAVGGGVPSDGLCFLCEAGRSATERQCQAGAGRLKWRWAGRAGGGGKAGWQQHWTQQCGRLVTGCGAPFPPRDSPSPRGRTAGLAEVGAAQGQFQVSSDASALGCPWRGRGRSAAGGSAEAGAMGLVAPEAIGWGAVARSSETE